MLAGGRRCGCYAAHAHGDIPQFLTLESLSCCDTLGFRDVKLHRRVCCWMVVLKPPLSTAKLWRWEELTGADPYVH